MAQKGVTNRRSKNRESLWKLTYAGKHVEKRGGKQEGENEKRSLGITLKSEKRAWELLA